VASDMETLFEWRDGKNLGGDVCGLYEGPKLDFSRRDEEYQLISRLRFKPGTFRMQV
jgi:hypothetical protein